MASKRVTTPGDSQRPCSDASPTTPGAGKQSVSRCHKSSAGWLDDAHCASLVRVRVTVGVGVGVRVRVWVKVKVRVRVI